ncbi:hypothetical protein BABINDRAFT_81744 [Babjeviella inositovora NRRL Y-12698]|uniref:Uncharacterized protein n=1 Tax=Babjeviella inositovora NRRL Y-12698 TaxID=984486 RepID=A0A1E3QZU6_9ASCO|nr:uncharacterized protein BABINDRAFT_81744 [Babjeviella inositovora NRRL Y-12698]ODQ83168.1 hypothetical protein BABINDRAFT_81744 [Babjeviella inositovora NRRL Y-12698]
MNSIFITLNRLLHTLHILYSPSNRPYSSSYFLQLIPSTVFSGLLSRVYCSSIVIRYRLLSGHIRQVPYIVAL